MTLRLWADSGKVPVTWVRRERRFCPDDIDATKPPRGESAERPSLEGLYVRVPGTAGQKSSLDAQEAELRAAATGTVAREFQNRASGLREDRPGLEKMLPAAAALVTTFAGRLYGMRSAAAPKRLPAESDRRPPGGVR